MFNYGKHINKKLKNKDENIFVFGSNTESEELKPISKQITFIDSKGYLITKDIKENIDSKGYFVSKDIKENIDSKGYFVSKDIKENIPLSQMNLLKKYEVIKCYNYQLLYLIRKYDRDSCIKEKVKVIKGIEEMLLKKKEYYSRLQSKKEEIISVDFFYIYTENNNCFYCNFLNGKVCKCKGNFKIEHNNDEFTTKDLINFNSSEGNEYILVNDNNESFLARVFRNEIIY